MKQLAKEVVEQVATRGGVAAASRRGRAGDTVILAYHNVAPHGEAVRGDRSLHLRQSEFARQLDLLARGHDVVPLSALADAPRSPRRPRAVITFDDAYQGTVTAAVEELVRRRLPATIFVAPAFVGGASFWWDALADRETGAVAPPVRDYALEVLEGRDAEIRSWARDHGNDVAQLPFHQTCATEAQLAALQHENITLGSHSWSHAALPRLAGVALKEELDAPRRWLAERFTNVVDWLAYPYGLYSPAVADAAREAGYAGALRVEGGWVGRPAPDDARRFVTPRLNIPAGLTIAGFEMRISGLL